MKRLLKYGLIILAVLFIFGVINNAKKGRDNGNTEKSVATEGAGQKEIKPGNIGIGIEYVLEGQDASAFGALGISAVKPLPESINWAKMQPKLSKPIDYRVADQFVKNYQQAGFRDIVFGLRTLSHAEDNGATYGKNRPVPKPEYEDDYAAWIKGIVERYDKDGIDDMPGLKYPVRYYEIEVEFSSYTPEPVEEYLKKLEIAYKAAHSAFADVLVAHSAFLTMTAFDSDPAPADYEKAFAAMYIPDKHHGLADMRKVLDRPDLFDRVNFHELGDPVMIERTVRWLNYEMKKRGYFKPIVISDTSPTPFISYGRATGCTGPLLGIIVWPAKESDRCRLADYFNKILDDDASTVAWKNRFVAGDMVKKVVVAAEQGIELINTSFTGDLPILSTKLGFAAAGNGGFGGVVSEKYNFFTKKYTVIEYRPGFYALKQLAEKLRNVNGISRETSDKDVRLYKVRTSDGSFWIGWLHPDYLVLPGDDEPERTVSLPLASGAVITEMATETTAPASQTVAAEGGATRIKLTMTPVYITASK